MSLNRQDDIYAELKKRISEGFYTDKLPKSTELAKEFCVNVKTLNKVMLRLVRMHFVERKRKRGTIICRTRSALPVIEIVYQGYQQINTNPYWMCLWQGLIDGLSSKKVYLQINNLKPQLDEGLEPDHLQLGNADARLVFGIMDRFFFNALKKQTTPFLSVGDFVCDIRIPQVTISNKKAIKKTVEALIKMGIQDIAFVGRTYTCEDSGGLIKFNTWKQTMLKYRRISQDLFVHAPFQEEATYQAAKELLERKIPAVILVASDIQIPAVLRAVEEKKYNVPVIGCDGISLPSDVSRIRAVPIQAPLFDCGKQAAEQIFHILQGDKIVQRTILESKFVPSELEKIKNTLCPVRRPCNS